MSSRPLSPGRRAREPACPRRADVDAQAMDDGGTPLSALSSLLRVFDSSGTCVASGGGMVPDPFTGVTSGDATLDYAVTADGTYYVGVSNAANTSYDPTVADSGSGGSGGGGPFGGVTVGATGDYRLQIIIAGDS